MERGILESPWWGLGLIYSGLVLSAFAIFGIFLYFFISPLLLVSSTIETDSPGEKYRDYTYSFANQNNYNLTIEVTSQSDISLGEGTGGFIVGEDGRFTIFVENNRTDSDGWAKTAEVISGELTAYGIKNLELALVMLEKSGSGYINVGDGRMFRDGDGFSEKTD